MNTFLIVLMILLPVMLVAILLFAIGMARYTVYGYRQTQEEAWNWQMEHVPAARVFTREMFRNYTIESYDGYQLHASYLPAREPSDKLVILAHGHTDTRLGNVKYMPYYYDLGFHIVTYDERGHGDNKRVPCTYGIKEAKDLMAVLEDTRKRLAPEILSGLNETHQGDAKAAEHGIADSGSAGPGHNDPGSAASDLKIGFHGESLGAATVLTSLQYHPDISFAVDDCGFADILNVLQLAITVRFHLPSWLVKLPSLACRILYGYFFEEARPIDALSDNQIPLLIFHGGDDDFILPSNSERVQKANAGYTELHIIAGAGHAASTIVAPEDYRRILTKFLKEHTNLF